MFMRFASFPQYLWNSVSSVDDLLFWLGRAVFNPYYKH